MVKLLDFGIALSKQDSRLTGTGEIFGTPQYMAPERITSGDPGPSADLYSLGVLFYEILTGQLPFDAPDIATFFQKHLKEPPVPLRKLDPRIPVPLEDLVLRMLAKDPKDRPVDAHRIHGDLIDLAREADVMIPSVPESAARVEMAFAVQEPQSASRTVDVDRWALRVETFATMLKNAYGDAPPIAATEQLSQLKELVPKITQLRTTAREAQRALALISEKGREGRQRFGFAVDALGVDASKARDEVRVVDAHFTIVHNRAEQAGVRYKTAHNDVLSWEGRCGFQEPSTDLAAAYRTIATATDSWVKAKEDERKAISMRESNERAVSDLDFQIQALRSALVTHGKEMDAEYAAAEKTMLSVSGDAAAKELEFITLAMRLCEPLRALPELSPMFQSLESDVAA